MLGHYDFSESGGESGTVDAPADREADTRYALRITVFSVVAAAVLTGAIYLLAGAL
ncbi:hypothetical protein [Halomarina litorea]|uniref:hypothetical protein n=1 Tax=Halomarina litorea TaxID=2961595 RepID=UPI0020C33842|nr:hypothetical protein [Halomarina sp. BCD28]